MKIRSITCFAGSIEALETAAAFLAVARHGFLAEGLEVQTVRLALPPLRVLFERGVGATALVDFARELEERGHDLGIDYLALGPHGPEDPRSWAEALPEVLSETQRVFVTMLLAGTRLGVSIDQAHHAARVIVASAPLEPNGFANLRFSALANVGPGVPYFPAAYAAGGGLSFAIATEAADLARDAFAQGEDLAAAAAMLVQGIEEKAARIERTARRLESEHLVTFGGVDFSLAPFPTDHDSVGATLESMGIAALGMPGTTAAAAVLTSAIDRARFTRAGFSGIFLPVLEDSLLATRASEGSLRVEDLLLASAVCGTGLDCVPLPGDTRAEEIVPYLLDLAALAQRLTKPLTARLMPMPGKSAGDELEFDFPFFANGRVMQLRSQPLGGAMSRGEMPIGPRPRRRA